MKILRKLWPTLSNSAKNIFSRNSTTNPLSEALSHGQRIDVGLWQDEKLSREIFSGYVPISIHKLEPRYIKTLNNLGLSKEEQSFYKDVLQEFRNIKPPRKEATPYSISEITEHANGSTSTISTTTHKVKRGWQIFEEDINPQFTLKENGKNLYVDIDSGTIQGDNNLITELRDFLQDDIPTVENLGKFLEYRDIKYLNSNGITNFNSLQKSINKAKEIVKLEENYHTQRQKMYETLWRPLHTEKFYRVVGKNELDKVLSGKTIVSTNSQARYGRSCVDITTNGYYNDIFYNEQKYRITFKVKDADGGYHTSLTENIYDFRPENKHYQIPSYTKADIAEIHAWDGANWQKMD